jgi:integrase
VRRFTAFMGRAVGLNELTEGEVCRYLQARRKVVNPVSTNNERRTILTLWKSAYDNDMAERPPRLGLIRRVPEEIDVPEAWTAAECNKLFSAAAQLPGKLAGIPARQWWLSLLLTVFYTGVRIGALCKTPVAGYTPGEGLLVRKQKNHRPQWYALPAQACQAIDVTLAAERELLWPWPFHRHLIFRRMRRLVEAAGIAAPRGHGQLFHRLRRTCLSLCASIDPAIAQRQGGHADYATTLKHYIDPRIARGRSAADVLPEAIISGVK